LHDRYESLAARRVEDAAAIDRSCGIVGERKSRRPFVVVSRSAAHNALLEAGRLAADPERDRALR